MSDMSYARQCSRWNVCSVNCCPLDPDHRTRPSISLDPEQTCLESPAHRVALVAQANAAGLPIPDGGLTSKELAGGLTPEQLETVFQEKHERRRQLGIRSASNLTRGRTTQLSGTQEPSEDVEKVEETTE